MTLSEFKVTLNTKTPPSNISDDLMALWLDARGNWSRAHEIVQESGSIAGDWIHAYLHRKEGDLSNASYWYRRAGKHMPEKDLIEEWDEIVEYLLKFENPF